MWLGMSWGRQANIFEIDFYDAATDSSISIYYIEDVSNYREQNDIIQIPIAIQPEMTSFDLWMVLFLIEALCI